ncbi:MAG TPA: UDP-N-acetylglucosamine 2-epimerase [Solirubrobacteraceae bacterium]
MNLEPRHGAPDDGERSSRRRVAVFASGRADIWPLRPVLQGAWRRQDLEITMIAPRRLHETSAILDAEQRVRTHVFETGLDRTDTPQSLLTYATRCGAEVGIVLSEQHPDLLMVVGDRFELLPVATAALLNGVPIVHLSGGEITAGVIDDSVRHAVTKLAHLHLCATEEYAARVRSLGEEPWRVQVTGEPSIDRLAGEAQAIDREQLEKRLGLALVPPVGILTYHAPTLNPERLVDELSACFAATEPLRTVVITHPGPDPGAWAIRERLRSFANAREGALLVETLGALFAPLLATADVMIGNSSSGIIEAATFGLPVVNVGDRQQGRTRPEGVIDVPGDPARALAAVQRALDPGYRGRLYGLPNPYGDGHAVDRVLTAIVEAPLDRLLRKRFVDPPPA